MTNILILFGASLMDSGNISHATDKFVLGEHIATKLGANRNEIKLVSALSSTTARNGKVHNYAHGGAHSGEDPYITTGDSIVPTGLSAQVNLFTQNKDFYKTIGDVDAVVSAGSNDILDAIEEGMLDAALETRSKKDDRRLIKAAVNSISGNLKQNVDRLTGIIDQVAVLNPFPLEATPLIKEKINQLDRFEATRLNKALDKISLGLSKKLNRHFRNNTSVAVVDVQRLWERLEKPSFIDAVHPSSRTSSKLADLIVSTMEVDLPGLGFNTSTTPAEL